MAKLTVILTQEVDNHTQTDMHNRWGLGDLIKGVSCTYSVCEEVGVDFATITSEHPVSHFYNLIDKSPQELLNGRNFHTFQNRNEMFSYIAALKETNRDDAIVTNGDGSWPEYLSYECKVYIKRLLTFNEAWQKAWENLGVGNANYSVLHIRMGDDHLINQHSSIPLYVKFLLFVLLLLLFVSLILYHTY